MADVYLATDERLDRKVAVKVIYPHLAKDPRFTEKFIREAKTAAKLNHPNLVNVFDQGTANGHTYMVMEYVPGITLRDAMDANKQISAANALHLLIQVLQGLAAAHKAGILHRDLKPENIFLSDDGPIKLGDFGLAREASAHTSTGTLMGTIAYIAPELLTRGQADARSDVYSIGIILFELLTGRQPFGGTDIAHIAHQHTAVGVPAPSTVLAGIPPLVDELTLWATAMNPQQRPANAQVLLDVVKRVYGELKAGNGATTRLDLPEFSGHKATRVISVDETAVIGDSFAAATGMAGSDATVNLAGAAAGAAASDATVNLAGVASGATTVIGDLNIEEQLHPLEVLSMRRRKRGKWIALTMATSVLLASGAGWWFSAGPGGLSALPDLTSSTLSNAQQVLSQYSGDVSIQKEYSSTVSSGLVTHTDPASGTSFWKGSHITIFISKGAQMVVVPNLRGMSPALAKTKLAEVGFNAGSADNYYSSAPKGTVFDYLGSDGTKIGLGSSIPLMVSAGSLPSVVGQQQTDALKALQAAGVKVSSVAMSYSDTVATGAVIAVQLASDPLPQGGSVTLSVSQGPTTVVLPNFKGETLAAAQLALKSLGLNVTVNTDQLQSAWGVVKVKSMSIAAGTVVKRGTQIIISNK
jgi:serine/threonine-protein kinase